MIRTAKLVKYFGLDDGQDVACTMRFRDKVLMKDAVAGAGLKCPQYGSVHHVLDLYQFIDDYGFGCVCLFMVGILLC